MSMTTDRAPSGSPPASPAAASWGVPQPSGRKGERLPARPRERKPALAALAVLLILGGALASMSLVLRSGDTVAAIGVAQPVPRGQRIPLEALREVQVARDSVAYVPWSQRGQVANYYAATALVPGSLLAASQVSRTGSVRTGQVVVGLALKPGQYPAGDPKGKPLQVGDTVKVYQVITSGSASNSAGAPPGRLLAATARVYDIQGVSGQSIGESTRQVSIVVDDGVAGAVAQAASNGNVALVLVPRAG
jgi:hypothetical protein